MNGERTPIIIGVILRRKDDFAEIPTYLKMTFLNGKQLPATSVLDTHFSLAFVPFSLLFSKYSHYVRESGALCL